MFKKKKDSSSSHSKSFLDSHPYLLEDSSMTSLRFSLIDMSIEWNFCLTCFRGSLLKSNKKKPLKQLRKR